MALAIPFQEVLVKVNAPRLLQPIEFGSDSMMVGTLINRMFHKRPFPKIDGLARVSDYMIYLIGLKGSLPLLGADTQGVF